MLLILLRHGIAAPPEDFETDFLRPLTPAGREKTRRAALGLKTLVEKFDFIASSPKIRARQTAEIVAEVWGKAAPPIVEWPELAEGKFGPLLFRISVLRAQSVLLVGHEPNLSQFAAEILTGKPNGFLFDWKKAGACALEIDLETGEAVLLWFMESKTLRELA